MLSCNWSSPGGGSASSSDPRLSSSWYLRSVKYSDPSAFSADPPHPPTTTTIPTTPPPWQPATFPMPRGDTQTHQSSSEKVQSPGRWGRDRHKVKVVRKLSIFRCGRRNAKLIMWRKSNLCLSPFYFKCQQTYNRNESESKEHNTRYNRVSSWKQTWKQLGGNVQLPSVQLYQ